MVDIANVHEAAAAAPGARFSGYWTTVGHRFLRDPLTVSVGSALLILVLLILLAPWIAPHDPFQGSVLRRLKPPGTPGYLLGTDEAGRDLLSRLLYGGRLSLLCGLTPVIAATFIGGALGIIAGISGRFVNMVIMRVTDIFYAFPSILLAIAFCGVLGSGIVNTIISLTIVFIPPLVRIAESLTTEVKVSDFVEAARATGVSTWQIVRHQVLANVLGGIIVFATGLVSLSIILSAGLSFLGLGVVPPNPEWGVMLNGLRQSLFVNPLIAALPGIAIVFTSILFNLLSDGLRNAMDSRISS
jgi:peptide/nickel transport system permease protein